jgi:hypothetical protein
VTAEERDSKPEWMRESLPPWQSVIRQMASYLKPKLDVNDAGFEPVLAELLSHRDLDVRAGAASLLSLHGPAGFRQALPVLIEVCRRHPDADQRCFAADSIADGSWQDPKTAKTALPDLLECHEHEQDQEIRNRLVWNLRRIDPRSDWPPVVQEFRFEERLSGPIRRLSNPWSDASASTDGTLLETVNDLTTPSGTGRALALPLSSPESSLHASLYLCNILRNIELRVVLKPVSGTVERGGGVIWRFRREGYYAAGMNALDGSLNLFKVMHRERIRLGRKDGLDLRTGKWHVLSVKHIDDKIECFLDGIKHLEAIDNTIATAGYFGFWIRADARTHFDSLRVSDYGE